MDHQVKNAILNLAWLHLEDHDSCGQHARLILEHFNWEQPISSESAGSEGANNRKLAPNNESRDPLSR